MEELAEKQIRVKEQMIERLLLYRKAVGMTQQELADAIGMSRSNVSRMTTPDYNPTIDMIVKVADGLGLDVDITFKTRN